MLGRPLTNAELTEVADTVRETLELGGGPFDVAGVLEDASGSTKSLLEMNHQEHAEFMKARLQDRTPQPDLNRELDISDPDGDDFRTWAAAKLAGHEFEDVEEEY